MLAPGKGAKYPVNEWPNRLVEKENQPKPKSNAHTFLYFPEPTKTIRDEMADKKAQKTTVLKRERRWGAQNGLFCFLFVILATVLFINGSVDNLILGPRKQPQQDHTLRVFASNVPRST